MKKPPLLLHACCAPCSTVAVERLRNSYEPVLYYYNPCIKPEEEFFKRLESLEKFARSSGLELVVPDQSVDEFNGIAAGREGEKEGGVRCSTCILQRLAHTAHAAANMGIEFFSTTLTTGPTKPAAIIFPMGERLALNFNISFVAEDFKKKGGFKRSVELSKELRLYRQNYCGCTPRPLDKIPASSLSEDTAKAFMPDSTLSGGLPHADG